MGTKKTTKSKPDKGKAETPAALPQIVRCHGDIDTKKIKQSPYQTRKGFGDMAGLIESVRTYGVLNPVTVRPLVKGGHELIAGERRWRAALELGLDTIPATIIECDDATAAEMCVTENMQRTDLSPIEEAQGVKMLLDTGHLLDDVANRLGRTRQWVARRASLNNLCAKVMARLDDPEDTLTAAPIEALEIIARMPPEAQDEIASSFRDQWAPTIKALRHTAGQMTCQLKNPPFALTDCTDCVKRSGAAPDLFENEDSECDLGRCLDRKCYNAKVQSARDALVSDIKAKEPKAVIMSDSWQISQNTTGVVESSRFQTCKKSDPAALPAYKINESGNATKVYIRGKVTEDGEIKKAAANQPDIEDKRRAFVIKKIESLLDDSCKSDNRPCPFEKMDVSDVVRAVTQFGTEYNQRGTDGTDWEELQTGDFDGVCFNLWTQVVPVLKMRMSFMTICKCHEAYDEAIAVAEWAFELKQADLDGEARIAKKDKKGEKI